MLPLSYSTTPTSTKPSPESSPRNSGSFFAFAPQTLLIDAHRRLSGQTCVCANRIFVQDSVYDAFASKLAIAVRAFKVGEGVGEEITHGPLIHAAAVAKVKRHVEDAKSKGARVLVGGEKMDVAGHFFQVRCRTPLFDSS